MRPLYQMGPRVPQADIESGALLRIDNTDQESNPIMEFPSLLVIAPYTMNSLQDLIAQKEALEKRIAQARLSDRTEKISRVKHLMNELGLRPADLNGVGKRPHRSSPSKVAAKYRDPVSGALWSGRGLAPKWIAGRDRAAFLIRP